MSWIVKAFNELTNEEIHEIFRLRVDVFVIEQECIYPEIDGKDPECLHLFRRINGQIIAYARIVPPGLSYEEPSIGRVIVRKEFRGKHLGEKLVAIAIEEIQKQWPEKGIKIGAQSYLEKFYASHGFNSVSKVYLEDGIPHIDMLLSS